MAAAVGFALQPEANLTEALYVVPVGMLLSVGFLFLWKTLPPLFDRFTFRIKLLALLATCISAWLLAATALEFAVTALLDAEIVPVEVIGMTFTAITLFVGLAMAILRPLPDQKAATLPPRKQYFYRSLAAALSIFCAVLLASVSSTLGGIVSTFPAIFCTTCVALTLAHGFDLSHAAVAPMMLGSLSVPVYAMAFAQIFPLLLRALDGRRVAAAAITVPLVWLLAILGVSVPVYLLLQRLKRRHANTPAPLVATATDAQITLLDGESSSSSHETIDLADSL